MLGVVTKVFHPRKIAVAYGGSGIGSEVYALGKACEGMEIGQTVESEIDCNPIVGPAARHIRASDVSRELAMGDRNLLARPLRPEWLGDGI